MREVTLSPSLHGLDGLMPTRDWQAVIEAAVTRWNQALASRCSVRVKVATPQHRWLANEDGVNLVVLRRGLWCHNEMCGHGATFPPNALAMTTVYPQGAHGAQVREADIEINGQMLHPARVHGVSPPGADHSTGEVWVSGPPRTNYPVPLEGVVMHEIGHALGLPDACANAHETGTALAFESCPAEQLNRVMFPDGRQLQPTAADLAELERMYPLTATGFSQPWLPLLLIVGIALAATFALVFMRRLIRRSSR